MINDEKRQALINGVRNSRDQAMAILKGLNEDDLQALSDVLAEMRPMKALSEMNLEHELIDQYEKVKTMQREVMTDTDVPANQRAQVVNAVAATLQQLIKMQTDFYNAERFKAIEALMIKAMRKLPKEAADEFLAEYEKVEA